MIVAAIPSPGATSPGPTRLYAQAMQVRVEVYGGADDELGQLERWLRSARTFDQLEVARGRAEIGPGELGAIEVLIFVATDVLLPLAVQGIYDFLRHRRRIRHSDDIRVRLTRTDLADGRRMVELDVEGTVDATVAMVRDALQ
jgi:hypothetical protein